MEIYGEVEKRRRKKKHLVDKNLQYNYFGGGMS